LQIYIDEINSLELQGVLHVISNVFLNAGSMALYAMASVPGLLYYHSALILLGVSVVYLLLCIGIPETAWWLVYENKEEESDIVALIAKSRGNITEAQAQSEYERLVSLKLRSITIFTKLKLIFCNLDNLITFFIITILYLLCELSGGGSLIESYAGQIFQASDTPRPHLVSTYSVGLSLTLSSALSGFLMTKVSRRTLLSISLGGMFIWSSILGYQNYFNAAVCHHYRDTNGSKAALPPDQTVCNQHIYPIAIIGVFLFSFSYSIGLGALPHLMLADLPEVVRKMSVTIIDAIQWPVASLVIWGFPSYLELVGLWVVWLTLGAFNLAGLIFVVVFVKNTKKETVEGFKNKFCCCGRYLCGTS